MKTAKRKVRRSPLKARYRGELKIPPWIQQIDDNCLRAMLFEVLTMKFYALTRATVPRARS
jgi:hypothetical protein